MKKTFASILIGFMITIGACRPAGEGSEKDVAEEPPAATVPKPEISGVQNLEGCYLMVSGSDSARLNLKINGAEASGELLYLWKEKDRNTGSFTGTITDTIIAGNYRFQSEGKTSVRELVFLVKKDTLIEGTGIVDVSSDTVRFRSRSEIRFDSNLVFVRSECP